MDNIHFYNSFSFKVITLKKFHHNDNSNGINCHFIGRIRQGNGKIVSDTGETLNLSKGDIFYLPLGLQYNSYWTPEDGEDGVVEWESYRFDFFPCKSGRQYIMQKLNPTDKALTFLDDIDLSFEVSNSSVGLLYAFLGEMFPLMSPVERDPQKELFSKARHYMYKHEHFKVSDLARHCGMSESGLYAFFRSYGQTTPIEEKNKILCQKAVLLLSSTDMSVEEISDKLGFHSAAYLRKILKKHTNKTPTELRTEGLSD